jgi:hypothetical protein
MPGEVRINFIEEGEIDLDLLESIGRGGGPF